jgi:hypothetical protein
MLIFASPDVGGVLAVKIKVKIATPFFPNGPSLRLARPVTPDQRIT